MEEEER